MSGEFVLEGLDECLKALEETIAEKIRKSSEAVEIAGLAYCADVQEGAPYKHGDYRRSIHVEPPTDEMGNPIVFIGTDKVQAKQLEFGGVIEAKNAPYLVFQVDGHWVQVKQVYQPGHPHFRPPLDQNGSKYQDIIAEELAK